MMETKNFNQVCIMKRIFSLFALASLAVLSLSCEKEIESPESGKAELYTYSFEAFDADADKSTFDGSKITWKEGDQVGYFVSDFSGNSVIGSDQKFTISTTKPVTGETLYAYVPYVDGNAAATSANITIPELQASDNLVMPAFGSATVAADGVVPIKLSNLGSIVAFKLYSATGAYSSEKVTSITMTSTTNAICGTFTKDITASSALEISGYDKNAVTVSVNGDLTAASSKENATVVYAVIAPGTYDGNIVVTTDAATYTYPFSNQTFQRSHSKGLVLNFEKTGVRESNKPASEPVYVKVTSEPSDWSGEYLIIYKSQDAALAFDGSLETLDAVSNTKSVTIKDGEIAATSEMKQIQFTVAKKTGQDDIYNLKSASGYYISGTTTSAKASNGIKQNSSDENYEISFGIVDNEAVVYSKSSDQNMILRYNSASDQTRFRFYKSGQNAIQLYKLSESSAPSKTLTSVAVSGTPTRTEYNVGDVFDPAGLVVTATYDDNSTADVTASAEWAITPNPLTDGTTSVSVVATVGEISSTAYNVDVTVAEVVDKEFTLFTNSTLVEGDYIVYYNGYALKNTISSSRFGYSTISLSSDGKIITSDESIIWHIAKVGDYWTLYNADVDKYAAGTTSKNQGTLLENVTDYAKWSCTTSDGKYELINLGRANGSSETGNKYLRNNGTSGFACYSSSTGGALTLYRNGEVEKISVTGVSLQESLTIEEGDKFTLTPTITPAEASNQNVTWSSNNEEVATVNNGVVTGVAEGTATITVKTVDGNFTADCEVTVTASSISIANTIETAYTPSEAKALIDAGKDLDTPVYVKGIVSKIVTPYDTSYGNISFNVSADGKTTGDQFQFFRTFKGADKEKWIDSDIKPQAGYSVVGYGILTKYSSTYEFAEGNYLVSYLGATADMTTVPAAGETVTITVNSNVEGWTVASDNDAFVVGAKSGNTVPIVVSSNASITEERRANIKVSADTVDDVVITLVQMKKAGSGSTTVLDFGTKSYGSSAYNTTWSYGDWNVVNGANNNKGWAYVKMGGKSATLSTYNPCYIYSTAAISHKVSKIKIDLPSGSLSKDGMSVKSWGVYVYSDKDMTAQVDYVAGGTITNTAGSFEFVPSTGITWNKNYYYKVIWDLSNTTTTNGIICVEKITLSEN